MKKKKVHVQISASILSLQYQGIDEQTMATCCPLTATLKTAALTGQARNHYRGWKVNFQVPYKHKTTLQLAFKYLGQFRPQIKFPTQAFNIGCTATPGIGRIQRHLSSVQVEFQYLQYPVSVFMATILPAETACQQLRTDCIFRRLKNDIRISPVQCSNHITIASTSSTTLFVPKHPQTPEIVFL